LLGSSQAGARSCRAPALSMIMMTDKQCAACEVVKPVSAFARARSRKDGLQPYCRECHSAKQKAHYRTEKGRETTRRCGKRSEQTLKRKAYKRAYLKTYVTRRNEAGICAECNTPVSGKTICDNCTEKKNESFRRRIAARKAEGLCMKCGRVKPLPSLIDKYWVVCEVCYLKQAANVTMKAAKLWRALKDKLEAQGYRCAYTGRPLVLGVNASIDQIFPTSQFPERISDPLNIEWVDKSVNQIKHALTPEQFFSLIREIAAHRPELNRLAVAA
jgi:hypothetical protein